MKRILFTIAATAAMTLSTVSTLALPSHEVTSVEELTLPKDPDGMTDTVNRADYILLHFWDSMDFSDTAKSHDYAFMEQNLVNFFSVMPHASVSGRETAVSNLMNIVSTDKTAFNLVAEIAEHYLYEPGSPMREEELFIPFVQAIVKSPILSDAERIRPQYMLEETLRNRVGTVSADFRMRLRNGSTVGMHEFSVGRPTILMFYDPDCDHCAETIMELKTDPELNHLIESEKINVIAVYPFGEADIWQADDALAKIPSEWTDAFADLSESDKYSFPEMPVIYLLDPQGTVILKDAPLSKISSTLIN
ncbi:MAG: DUF5106 domain-containing protein [Muribaculum sp.]|nr:DUF5106 domain-containing protein [Muribaculum sp.]